MPKSHAAKRKTAGPKPDPAKAADFGSLGIEGRIAKGDLVRLEETMQAGQRRARVHSQTMIDRYLQRGQITRRQFDAAEKLHALWRAAGSAQGVVATYGIRIKGRGDLSERQSILRAEVTKTLSRLGSRLASVLVHVCLCDDAAGDWGERHRGKATDGIALLRLALDTLADHWGLPGDAG